jgi:hypothetical protein
MKNGIFINGTVLSSTPTPKGAFVLKVLITDFIVSVHTKTNAVPNSSYSAQVANSDKGDFYFERERIAVTK